MASDVFEVLVLSMIGETVGSVGTIGSVPALGIERVLQVLPALPLTLWHGSSKVESGRALRWL